MYILAPGLILPLEIQSKYIDPLLESIFIDINFFKSLIKTKIYSLNTVLQKVVFA